MMRMKIMSNNNIIEECKKKEMAISNIKNIIECKKDKLSEEEIESLNIGIKAIESIIYLGKQCGCY